ncbi:MAG: 3-phosphoshikimate 1-carboxyvinyltransferase [Ruminococcus sp.]|nr:3-phosphoshikimate 1-carboxyvinyltransferase [Ruminococcus sp.]
MDIEITPKKLSGRVTVPPSKSAAHRMLVAAALAEGHSEIRRLAPSKDIIATMEALRALGAEIELKGTTARITGIKTPPKEAEIDCCESGSTLRFLIPVAAALGVKARFIGQGNLPNRPITPYLQELPKHGAEFEYEGTMPFTVSGQLTGGRYLIDGSISSQFITGLIFALAVLERDSDIVLTSPLQSRPYVDITIGTLAQFGCEVTETDEGYHIKGGQRLEPFDGEVEGDYSQAAFFQVADSLGSEIEISGLSEKSFQGDKKIIEICKEIVYNKNGGLSPFTLDCSDIPDLVPILSVLASFCDGESRIENVGRLRIKECDRLAAMEHDLNLVGGKVKAYDDFLVIEGVGSLRGGRVPSFNDHRIAMAMAVAATRCEEKLIIEDAGCVSKSYPDFWEVYRSVGGDIRSL